MLAGTEPPLAERVTIAGRPHLHLAAPIRDQGVTVAYAQSLFELSQQAVSAIQKGKLKIAVDKLNKSLERTDGCVLRGSPDGNGPERDWITDCDSQAVIYQLLSDARAALTE